MRRRDFIALLGGAAASPAIPLASKAQEANRIYRIGFLTAGLREAAQYVAFFDELRMTGFIETLPSLGEDLAFAMNSFPRQRRRLSNPRLMRLSALGRSRRVP